MMGTATQKLPPAVRNALSQFKFKCIFAGRALRGTPVRRQRIQLTNTLIGEQCGTPLEHWIAQTGELNRASVPLQQSPYVQFLTAAEKEPARLNEPTFLRSQAYFAMAQVAIRHSGNYFAAVDEEGIFQQMRDFFAMYQSLRDGIRRPASSTAPGRSLRNSLIWVNAIRDSNFFELSDGHHRASALLASGQSTVEALVVHRKYSYTQQQIHVAQHSRNPYTEQPIPLPEVRSWPPGARVERWWRAMDTFAQESGLACVANQTHSHRSNSQSAKSFRAPTVLHAPCAFGWFVRQWTDLGYAACGFTDSIAHHRVGSISYQLHADQLAPPPRDWHTVPAADIVFAELGKPHSPFPFQQPTLDFFKWLDARQSRLCFIVVHHAAPSANHCTPSDQLRIIEPLAEPYGWRRWQVLAAESHSNTQESAGAQQHPPATLLAAVREGV